MKIIKELKGNSGSKIFLMNEDVTYVRKIGNIERNLERIEKLKKLDFPFPKIIHATELYYDMEYVPNLDVKNFLLKNQAHRLANFIKISIDKLAKNSVIKDYRDVYDKKLALINFNELGFTKQELIDKLPTHLPSSEYHGDMTLENILFDVNNGNFIFIDPLTTDYDSWVFDLAKLKQDIVCKWFIRNEKIYLDQKLKNLEEELSSYEYFDNDAILILMLLRVLPYSKNSDKKFIINEVKKLWK